MIPAQFIFEMTVLNIDDFWIPIAFYEYFSYSQILA